MNKYKKFLLLLLIVVILILIIVLHKSNYEKKNPISVVYIPKIEDATNDFWTTLIEGAREAADEYNINLTIYSPTSETDYETQNELLQKAADEYPDVIALSPISYTESNVILEKIKNEYNIPIVLIDSAVSSDVQTSTISSDNIDGGRQMGYYALNLIDDNSKIAIVSHVPNASTAIEREEGFRNALGEHEKQIVDVVYSYSDFTTAYNATKELMEEYPDITLIAGLNEYSAVGAGRAIKDLGLAGKVNIIGFDNSIAAVNMMEENIFCALVIQKPFNMGYLGIETAYKVAKKIKVEEKINSGCELITIDDMYTDSGQKSLFSFLGQ